MTDRRNKGKYEVCQDCGAHLDHGEQCDCREEDSSQDAVYVDADGKVLGDRTYLYLI